ncbi:MAG: N-acyl homoserine lactonase family protein [Bacteroidetes bacterium]|nr:N-acyl homoserine lactonase family protein [Bacteroidota bacterium]
MKYQISKPLRFADGDGFLHGFSTGEVKVKSRFKTARFGQQLSKLDFLFDRSWTDFMPIMVWVIQHPEGLFVVDTGENAQVSDEGYFDQESAFARFINTHYFSFDVRPEEEVGPQLNRLGFEEKDLSSIILTHLHLDHFDGLKHFPNTPILVHDYEWDHQDFALPSLYPDWFEPKQLKLQQKASTPFRAQKKITQSGEVSLVYSPGHTRGHCSVLVKSNDMHFFIAGDVTYTQDQLLQETQAGAHQDFKMSKQTWKQIKTYANSHKLIYLPSHDPESVNRLKENDYLSIN